MNLNNAKYISTIVEHGSLAKAAEILYVSQPALSQTIKQVEEELGVKIFQKKGRSLKLTPAGKLYLNTAQQMMLLDKNLKDELTYLKPNRGATIKFGISVEYGRTLLPKIIYELRKNRPNINLNITLMGSTDLEKALSENKIDVAVCSNVSSFSSLDYIFLSKDILGVLVGEYSYLYNTFINGQSISLSDTISSNFVSLTKGHYSRFVLDSLLSSNNLTARNLFEVGNFEIAKNIAIYCGDVFITSYALVKHDIENEIVKAKFFPLKNIAIEKKMFLIKSKDKFVDDDMAYFLDLVKRLSSYMLDLPESVSL